MRAILAVAVLGLSACDVASDEGNEQVTINYDRERIERTADDVRRGAEDVAAGVGNVAGQTGRAIQNEVGNIDVDVDVNRTRPAPEQ